MIAPTSLVKRMVPRRVKERVRPLAGYSSLLLEPIDNLARAITGTSHLPPLRVRRLSGPLSSFETSSASFLGFLSAACGISPQDRVLDIGCGCGAIPLQLLHFFQEGGGYVGVDVDPTSIGWAQRSLTPRDHRLSFQLIDVANNEYNPAGRRSAADYTFPFPDRSFDVILAKSLFTHLRPPEVENYLKEIARLLADGGRALMTFFLFSGPMESTVGRSAFPFRHDRGVWRYDDEEVPERAIGYDEEYVRGLLARYGLELERPIFRSHQDTLVIRRGRSELEAGGARPAQASS